MTKFQRCALFLVAFGLIVSANAAAGEHRLGLGYHQWKAVDDISVEGVKDSGSSQVFSYQYLASAMMRYEIDVEYFSDGYGGSGEKAYAPQLYLLFGRFFYSGLGIGMTKSDGFPDNKSWSGPWYALKAGVDLLLLPKIHLDVNANYRTRAFKSLQNAKTGAMTLGASVRVSLN